MKGFEPMIKESDEIGDEIAEMVAAALREKLLNVVGEQPAAAGQTNSKEMKYALADLQNRYDKLGRLLNDKPKDVRKGRFSLGDEVSILDPDARTDALVFICASGVKLTKGKKMYGLLVPGASLWSNISVSLAVVDSKSGEVLYFAKFGAKGDFVDKTREVLFESLRKALRELPVAIRQGS